MENKTEKLKFCFWYYRLLRSYWKTADFGADGILYRSGNGVNYYSYFSITPFGYATYYTFPLAVCTCVMVASGILSLVWHNNAIRVIISLSALPASIFALLSLIFSFSSVSVIGIILLLLTTGAFALAFLSAGAIKKKK